MAWISTETDEDLLAEVWADALSIEPSALLVVLRAGQSQCEAWSGQTFHGLATIPESFKFANILWARHIWTTAQAGNRTALGADGYEYAVSTWPLVLQARELLKPRTPAYGRLR